MQWAVSIENRVADLCVFNIIKRNWEIEGKLIRKNNDGRDKEWKKKYMKYKKKNVIRKVDLNYNMNCQVVILLASQIDGPEPLGHLIKSKKKKK